MSQLELIIPEIVQKYLGETITHIERLKIGICNEVFLISTSQWKMVLRMNQKNDALLWTENHTKLFQSLEIPVPKIIFSDYSQETFPYNLQIIEYIDWVDLGLVIESLSPKELKNIASEVVNIFNKLATVPTNGKFGWIEIDNSQLMDSWWDIMKADVIEPRNALTGVVGNELIEKEKELYKSCLPYFNTVKSTLFYDDITSKNILIKDGKFVGLVDLDCLMCGDPLETIGSIKASWFGTVYGDIYTKSIEDGLWLNAEQRKMVTAYAILNRTLWLSEIWIKFNENTTSEIDWKKVEENKNIINNLYEELEK